MFDRKRASVYLTGIVAAACVAVSACPAAAQDPAAGAGRGDPYAAMARPAAPGAGRWAGAPENYSPAFTFQAAGALEALLASLRSGPGAVSRGTEEPEPTPTETPEQPSVDKPEQPSVDMPPFPAGEQPELQNADPCGEGGKSPAGCSAREGNQTEIEACPPGSAGCLAKYATDGEATRTDLNATAVFVETLANKDRYASPQRATAQMCGIFSQHIRFYRPDQYQFPPTTHNCLPGLSDQDHEHATVTPLGTLTRLPAVQPQ